MVMDLSQQLISPNISNLGAKNSDAEIHNQIQAENSFTSLTFLSGYGNISFFSDSPFPSK
jgi:hypothetical protein